MIGIVLYKLFSFISEIQRTINEMSKELNVILSHLKDTVVEVNVLLEDVKIKVQKIDPLFSTVAELSESISDINCSSRKMVAKIKRGPFSRRKNLYSIKLILGLVKLILSKRK